MNRFSKRTYHFITAFLLLFGSSNAKAQNEDANWSVWEDASIHDTIRLEALRAAIWERYLFTQPDSAFYYAEVLYEGAESVGMKMLMAEAVNIQAGSFFVKGEIAIAIPYAERYVELYELHWPNSHNHATALINMGSMYSSVGDNIKAIQCFKQSLKLAEEHDNLDVRRGSLNNLGEEYSSLGDYNAALRYFERSLVLTRELGDNAKLGQSLSNIGKVYKSQGQFEKALDFALQALEAHEELGDTYHLGGTMILIGLIYKDLEDYEKSFDYLLRAFEMGKESEMKRTAIGSSIGLGELYLARDEPTRASEYCKIGFDIAQKSGLIDEELEACNCLYQVHKSLDNAEQALNYLERSKNLRDSLKVTETAKKLQRMEFDKELLSDSLRQEEEKHTMELIHQEEVAKKDKTRNMLMSSGLLLLLLAGGLFSRNRYVNRSKKQIQKEKDRSEELLLNILPEEVAEELKDKGEAEAQLIDQVTVLFTDFKGFTAMSEKLSPKELVNDLNECFSEFDRITAKYGIEKIKTIGDAYMAAGGLPTPNDTHATDVIKAAMEMRDFVEAGKARKIKAGQPYFEIRIGINTGPVVAGIVGVKKFQYDIWGDTVNTASRMESSGEVGKVNISQTTFELVKDISTFDFESRGKVEAKGKGEMEMFFVYKT